ncbi:MAG TPA: tetratricopeptide repeat protein [Fimbriimonadaceae bacterium]|nr:tetratricopeptide repeat protein [Fimbriimonadaceae bacterium]
MKLWLPVGLFVAVAAWMVFAAHSPSDKQGLYTIQNDVQFNEVLGKVRDLIQQPIVNFDSGVKLTDQQVKDLKEGETLIKQMVAYAPANFGPYVMLAKTQRALGEMDQALRNYQQALDMAPKDSNEPSVVITIAEVKFDLGSYYYERSEYDKADKLVDEAIGAVPDNAKYLSTSAAIKSQIGKPNEARTLVDRALKLNPNDATAKSLDVELKRIGH